MIDLKTLFNEPKDYANAIEPDVPGGAKIVENILYVVNHHRFNENISATKCRAKLLFEAMRNTNNNSQEMLSSSNEFLGSGVPVVGTVAAILKKITS